PLVIDADALNLLAADGALMELLRNRKAPSVLTPHPGEAGRLLHLSNQTIQADRVTAINTLVKKTKSVCVLKGSGSLVASPEHAPEICKAGNPGMATAGMGDVLTGIVAALIGQGIRNKLSALDATRLAVLLHAMAADSLVSKGIGPIGLTALEVAHEVRQLINHYAEHTSITDTDGLAFLLDSP
ncbi:MAG TPA: ADP/ATP-dependent (S)-NAD(P)H-hydrate dehydratase, partial [Methyloradius sp.]